MDEQLRLVVAEDNETDALLIARHLAKAGVKCTMRRVETEDDFVGALVDVEPDVIISDYSMPQFDGQRALEIASIRAPDTPFLFVSGTIGEERAIDALQRGATDYILKSNLTRLAPAVQRAVREAALKRTQRQLLTTAGEKSETHLAPGAIRYRPTTRSLALEARLAGALERDEFRLHYQPKINLTTGSIEGFEALLRWQDSEEELVAPSVFIPLLERSGAIVDVGAWVLLQAAHDIHQWRAEGLPNIRVAVNISALQLRRRDFVAQVLSCVGSSKAPAGIDIELTESMLMQDSELATRKLAELREAGVGVALDHFGTSSCSLPLLAGLPVSALKIDRSYVQRAGECRKVTTLVSTIISLARSFGMQTIAEGVETAQQLQMLRQMCCDQAQGYFLARPGPVSDVSSVIARLSHDWVYARCA
jgi:EAL domain-containing protein (putative c-di-GMP-specific phosphodiesterase class I)/CheY-like chemotaxis protein